jgi:hypothetical protein
MDDIATREPLRNTDEIDPRHALLAQAGAWDVLVARQEVELNDAFGQLVDGVGKIVGFPECATCGEAPCLNETFCTACRKADRQRKPADEHTKFLRKLLDPKVGLDAAWRAIDQRRHQRAAR